MIVLYRSRIHELANQQPFEFLLWESNCLGAWGKLYGMEGQEALR